MFYIYFWFTEYFLSQSHFIMMLKIVLLFDVICVFSVHDSIILQFFISFITSFISNTMLQNETFSCFYSVSIFLKITYYSSDVFLPDTTWIRYYFIFTANINNHFISISAHKEIQIIIIEKNQLCVVNKHMICLSWVHESIILQFFIRFIVLFEMKCPKLIRQRSMLFPFCSYLFCINIKYS